MDEKPRITNRDRRRAPKRGGAICFNCDRYYVNDGARCACGYMSRSPKREKHGAR